jgi:MFS superfamily sulfate permease-like transporter
LVAQGAGNMISGLIGGLPITQVIVRSSANIMSGGRTKLSAILHGLLLIVSVLVIPGLLNLIPLSSLAAILLVVGYKLAKPAQFVSIAKSGIRNFIPFVVTVLAIVFTDLLVGIGIGMVVALILVIEGYVRTGAKFSFKPRLEKEEEKQNEFTLRLGKMVPFLHKAGMQRMLEQLPENGKVTIDATNTEQLDTDVEDIISNFVDAKQAEQRDWQFQR